MSKHSINTIMLKDLAYVIGAWIVDSQKPDHSFVTKNLEKRSRIQDVQTNNLIREIKSSEYVEKRIDFIDLWQNEIESKTIHDLIEQASLCETNIGLWLIANEDFRNIYCQKELEFATFLYEKLETKIKKTTKK